MEIVKTGSSDGNGGNIKTTTKSIFQRDVKRVSVKNILSDHFRKTK